MGLGVGPAFIGPKGGVEFQGQKWRERPSTWVQLEGQMALENRTWHLALTGVRQALEASKVWLHLAGQWGKRCGPPPSPSAWQGGVAPGLSGSQPQLCPLPAEAWP